MISVHFQGKPFNITVIQVYTPTSNAEEAEVDNILPKGPLAGQSQRCNFIDKIHGFSPLCEINFR